MNGAVSKVLKDLAAVLQIPDASHPGLTPRLASPRGLGQVSRQQVRDPGLSLEVGFRGGETLQPALGVPVKSLASSNITQ